MTDESIFAAALAIGSPAERAAYLDRACAGRPELRRDVEELLAAHAADNPLDRPPIDLARTGAYEPPREQPGVSVGPYKLLQEIGEGGMGTVFMAEQQEPVRRKVALKIIKPGMDSKQVIARFEAERQALSMMDHPNIARVLDAGTTPAGRPFFVMELVHGVPITDFCDANKLTPRQRLELFVPVCQAIQHAHQKGVIHRDIKPGNILVTMYDDKPVPKVIDFGVAKAVEQRLTERTLFTQFGVLIGTFEYMSPEQAEMNAFGVDTRSDVYALGVLLYELLTGTTPLERQRLREAALGEVVRIIKEEEPPRPSVRLSTSDTLAKVAAARRTEPAKLSALVRGELDWIVMKCLEKDRTRRYDTASALARDVERYLHDEPVEACPPTLGYRLRKFSRKFGPAIAAVVLIAGLMLGTTFFSLWQMKRAMVAEAVAATERDMAVAAQHAAELSAASLQVDLDLAECRQDSRNGLLRLARTLKGLPADLRELREFVTAAVLVVGQEYAPLLPPLTHDGAAVTKAWLSPDSQTVLTFGEDSTARLWETRTARLIAVLRKGDERVENCGYSPDGRTVFTDDGRSVARFWDVPSGRFRAATDPRPYRYALPMLHKIGAADRDVDTAAAAQISGGRLLTRRFVGETNQEQEHWEGPVELWDTATGRLVTRFDRPDLGVPQFGFAGGGRWVTTTDGRSELLVYSAEDGHLLSRLRHPEGERVLLAGASPAGRRLATITMKPNDESLVRTWDTASWKAEPGVIHIKRAYFLVRFLTDDVFARAEYDTVLHRWELKLHRVGHSESIADFAVVGSPWPRRSGDGKRAHSGDGRVLDTEPWQRLLPPPGRKFHPDLACFAPDGRFVGAVVNNENVLIDTRTEKHFATLPDWGNLSAFGMVAAVRGYGLGQAVVRVIPPPARLDLTPDLLELWVKVAVRGEIGADGSFVKWSEPTWERKRQELAVRPPPWPDFPFPGHVATDRLHWLRKEYESASGADKPRLAKELFARAEAAGDKAEAAWWRAKLKQE